MTKFDRFYESFTFGVLGGGYLDINTAFNTAAKVEIDERDVVDIIIDFKESCGYSDFSKIDPVYVIYEHILQQSRNAIDELCGFDFENDSDGCIYTYGNYMCTSFDWNEEGKEDLTIILECLNEEQKEELLENNFVKFFLQELEIEL